MDTLSFHITDIASNCVRAGATQIVLDITVNNDTVTIRIADNGCGMDTETVMHVTDPFYTTRTTRKVGLGIPFLKQNAEQTGGSIKIVSCPGKGTEITARFITSHIDCPPWGDLAGTVATLLTGTPDSNVSFSYRKGEEPFALSTDELKGIFEDIPLSHPKVILLVKEMIAENLA